MPLSHGYAESRSDLPNIRARGDCGELRAGYQTAARLGEWELTFVQRVPRTFRLTAHVLDWHPYWATQGPHDLVLVLAHTAAWVWHHVVVEPGGTRLVVDLTERPETAPASQFRVTP